MEWREKAMAAHDTTARAGSVVLLTDHPWPDVDIERAVIEAAGFTLVAGPVAAPDASAIADHVGQTDPAAIMTCWGVVSAAAIALPRDLRIVARMGVGLDNIAVVAATERGAWVTNVPDYCVGEVSDHAIAMVLGHARGIVRLDAKTKSAGWRPAGGGLERVADLTIGIIGYGRIGRETGRKLRAFGCAVLAADPTYIDDADGVAVASVATIQARADVVILHAPLVAATAGMINDAFLAACRRRPLIVNVSRGGLIDNAALIRALIAGTVRGAALDVIDGEPSPPAELFGRADVIVTPHVAFASDASLAELRRRSCEEVVRVLAGARPYFPCNAPTIGAALPGGVASDIRVVPGSDGPEVVKRALAKLKVEADWFSSPERSSTEVAAIAAFGELIGPAAVPTVVWSRPDDNSFAMRLVDPRLRNWKQDLLGGRIDLATARRAGELIGQVHARSADRDDLQRRFAETDFFTELRIDPFFRAVGTRSPSFKAAIDDVVAGMADRRTALVHGDYSPKNLLADGSDVVVLDFEVAHWGDPRFDVAFCISHLVLKAHRRGADRVALARAIDAFLAAYAAAGPAIDDADLVRITGCLTLARFDGSSPVDYLADIDHPAARAMAEVMINHPASSLTAQFAHFAELQP